MPKNKKINKSKFKMSRMQAAIILAGDYKKALELIDEADTLLTTININNYE